MFFLQITSNYKQRQIKTFSIAYRNDFEDLRASIKNPLMCMKRIPARRTVFAPPISLRGSMTLEAALLLPFFLLFMLSLYSVIDMLRLHASVTWYLHQVGNEISVYGHLADDIGIEEESLLDVVGDIGFSYLYVKEQLEEKVDFPGEVFFSTISILEDGKVSLGLTFSYPLPIAIGGQTEVWLQSRYEGSAWLGMETALDGQWAYVTENGEVYHLFADCTHLDLAVQEVPSESLESLESALGRKLQACTMCTPRMEEMVYITIEQGRYHYYRDCGSLKRTVMVEELEKVQGKYALCLRCKERESKDE